MATGRKTELSYLEALMAERYPKETSTEHLQQAQGLLQYYSQEQIREMLARPEERPRILVVESDPRFGKELTDQISTAKIVSVTDANEASTIYHEHKPFVRMILVAEHSDRRDTADSYPEWNYDIIRQLHSRFPGFLIGMSDNPDLERTFQMGRAGCDDIIFPKSKVPSETSALLERQQQGVHNIAGGDWLGQVCAYLRMSKIDGIDWNNCLALYEETCRMTRSQ